MKDLAIRTFMRIFKVDLQEAAEPDPRAYRSFNAFFTRALRPGSRCVPESETLLRCPVDGSVSEIGALDGSSLLQAKGQTYSCISLLGGDPQRAQPFLGGHFATLYLSPRDYHRIHMPCAGTLKEMIYVPGKLFSVSPLTARVVPQLFARNERLVALFDTPFGPMAMIMVGAMCVASMETVWEGVITPPHNQSVRVWHYDSIAGGVPIRQFKQGEEMGRFNMGSTVILLFQAGAIAWRADLDPGDSVRVGATLANKSMDI